MKPGSAYYAGGARVVVDGIPLRLVRKPGATYARWLKERDEPEKRSAIDRANDAKQVMQIYADMLEISLTQAKVRIDIQRLHVLANPLRDLSMEYDL